MINESTFEVLNDGSTALVMKPGYRLKLKLSELLEGGDEDKEEREKEKRRKAKRRAKYASAAGGGMWSYGGGGTSTGIGGGSSGGGGISSAWDEDPWSSAWFKPKEVGYFHVIIA